MKRKFICSAIFDLVLAGILIGYPLARRSALNDESCNRAPILMWLVVQGGLELFNFFTKLFQLICFGFWNCTLKSKRTWDLVNCMLTTNFQFAWLVYGNTFIYSDDAIHCKYFDLEGGSKNVWELMLAIIIIGYIFFVFYCFLACLFPILIVTVCFLGRSVNRNNNPIVDRIPYLNAVKGLSKKNYQNI